MWACSRGFVIICKIIKYSTFSNICQYFLTAGMTIMTPRSREVPIQWFWLPLAPSIQTLGTRSIFYFSSSSSSFLPSRQESFKQHFFHFEILNLFRQWYPQKMSQLTSTRRWQRESNLPFDFLNNQNRLIFDGDGEIFFVSQESSDCFNALPSDDSDNIVKWKVSID